MDDYGRGGLLPNPRQVEYRRRTALAEYNQLNGGPPQAWLDAGALFEDVHGRFGSEPPVGTVLRWKRPVGPGLDYVATRAGDGRWYVTGQQSGSQDWARIVAWIGDNECHVAVSWREIPRPEPEPSGDDAVADWAAQFIPPSASSPATPPWGPDDVPEDTTMSEQERHMYGLDAPDSAPEAGVPEGSLFHGMANAEYDTGGQHTHRGLSHPLIHAHPVPGAGRVEHAHDETGWAPRPNYQATDLRKGTDA